MRYAFIAAAALVSIVVQAFFKKFTAEQCQKNPCMNNGRCFAGKNNCVCDKGWMGRWCHRKCRDVYRSCDRWAIEGKCNSILAQTNFFEVNCAVACKLCVPDAAQTLPSVPLPPALEPLQFMIGKWYSQAAKGLRFPTDFYDNEYEEVLEIWPAETPMFGPPSLNLTSRSWIGDDVRLTHGFITLKPNTFPPEAAILSTGNEGYSYYSIICHLGLNMIELGKIKNQVLTLNVSYMQVHPTMDNNVLPLGVTHIRCVVKLYLGYSSVPKSGKSARDDSRQTFHFKQNITVQKNVQENA